MVKELKSLIRNQNNPLDCDDPSLKRFQISLLLGLIGVLWTLLHPLAQGQTLVIYSSDIHSQYDLAYESLLVQEYMIQKFQDRYPKGSVIYLVNGDVGGPSEWTKFDRGNLAYEILYNIRDRFPLVLNLGNHEAFSLGQSQSGEGNRLFVEQTEKILLKNKQKPIHWTVANIKPSTEFSGFFREYYDLTTNDGLRLRVIGLTLERFFEFSTYSRERGPQIIDEVRPILETAQEQIEKAARDGVTTILFQIHEGLRALHSENWNHSIIYRLLVWKNKHADPRVRNLKIPVVFAAHTHEINEAKVGTTKVLEAGSRYDFAALIIDKDGILSECEIFDLYKRSQLVRVHQLERRLQPERLRKVRQLQDQIEGVITKN